MRTLLFILIAASIIASCKKEEAEPSIQPTLSVEPVALSFTSHATEHHEVIVTTNQSSWDAVSSQAWCTITKNNGKFTVKATVNTSTSSPTPAIITITAGKATPVTINVTQAGVNAELFVTPNYPVSFTYTGGTSEVFSVTTNQMSWNALSNQTWCTINKIGNTFTLTTSENSEAESRKAAITISGGNAASVTIEVTQSGVGAKLSIYPDAPIKFTDTGGINEAKVITVTTNQTSWDAVSNQTWCVVTKSSKQFTITASANIESTERIATITVSAGNAAKVRVEIKQESALSVVKATYVTPSNSGSFNPILANYTITWTPLNGVSEYNVYKSTTSNDEAILVEKTSENTFSGIELLASGTYVRYYWVTAKTNSGETIRPNNGGIKVTYIVTLSSKIWMPNSIPPMYGSWITVGVNSIDRTVTQNPIE